MKVPTTLSYNGTFYLHPSGYQAPGRPEQAGFPSQSPPATSASGSAMPPRLAGRRRRGPGPRRRQGHAIRRSIYTDITQALRLLPADAVGKDYEVTLAFKVVPSRRVGSPRP